MTNLTTNPVEVAAPAMPAAPGVGAPDDTAPVTRRDWWIVAGLVFYCALGAGLTLLMLNANNAETGPVAVKPRPNVQGKAFRAPTPPAPGPGANSSNAGATANASGADKITDPQPYAPLQPQPAPVPAGMDKDRPEYQSISMATLSGYKYEFPDFSDPNGGMSPEELIRKSQIPAEIKAFSGKKIAIRGFMMPCEVSRNRCSSFMLVASQLYCCNGKIPLLNEWIMVRLPEGKMINIIMDQVITVYGTLTVGEEFQDGFLVDLYRMVADDVTAIRDW